MDRRLKIQEIECLKENGFHIQKDIYTYNCIETVTKDLQKFTLGKQISASRGVVVTKYCLLWEGNFKVFFFFSYVIVHKSPVPDRPHDSE